METSLIRATAVLAAALWLSGCVEAPSAGGDSSSGQLGASVGVATAPYMRLDLDTGNYESLVEPGDLSSATLRDRYLLFRRVEAPGGPAYLGVFEVTQAQWQRLGGGSPWLAVDSSVVASSGVGADRPAWNLSWDLIADTVSSWNTGRSARLAVPNRDQWRAAAGIGRWSWGDSRARTTVVANAVVHETQVGTNAPAAVASRNANARGFFDLGGNVWEWCAPGTDVLGGSWRDGVESARSANQLSATDAGIDPDAGHACFGVRLLLLP